MTFILPNEQAETIFCVKNQLICSNNNYLLQLNSINYFLSFVTAKLHEKMLQIKIK